MSKYRNWKHPESGVIQSVKIGWSWPAFLFGGLWAITKRMTLLGISMLVVSIAVGYAIVTTQSEDDHDFLLMGASLIFGLIFGANGNSWREWHLRRRRFGPGVLEEKPFLEPVRTLVVHPIVSLKTVRRDKIWSAVIAGLIVAAIVGGVSYLMLPRRAADDANTGMHNFVCQKCKSCILTADVQPYGDETLAWFEWGETPNLGTATIKQRFNDDSDYYQVVDGLEENTTYFYRAVAQNVNGIGEGRVYSFTTARCER